MMLELTNKGFTTAIKVFQEAIMNMLQKRKKLKISVKTWKIQRRTKWKL